MPHFVFSGEPRFVFHTAIEPTDPAPPEGANPRRSIEARCVVVHFDRGIPGKPSNMAPVGRSQPKASGRAAMHTNAGGALTPRRTGRGRLGFGGRRQLSSMSASAAMQPVERYTPIGEELMVGNLPMYYVAAGGDMAASQKGVVVLQEIWGWSHGQTAGRLRSICDTLASEGFHVVLPDCHRGDSAEGKPDKVAWIRSISQPVDGVVADVRRAADWLRERGVRSVGAVGFCWGAWAFAHASAAGVPLACGVGAHPSFKNESNCGFGTDEELAKRVQMPVLLLSAGDDPSNVQEDGAVTHALAQTGGRTRGFSQMKHGWVTRGDLDEPRIAADVELALTEMLAFLRAHVR